MTENRAPSSRPGVGQQQQAGGGAQPKAAKKPTTLDKIQAMEAKRAERREQIKAMQEEKKLQEEKNAELGVVGDADFVRMIGEWRGAQRQGARHEPFDCEAGGRAKGKELCICVRKRPLGKREEQANDHDAVSCTNPTVVVHDCKHRVDGITKYLNNTSFVFDHAFSETTTTQAVYECVGFPLVKFVVQRRGRATVFAYGQTGSGKTYTMQGIEERAAKDVFRLLEKESDTSVTVSFFEIYGGRCQDLLRERARLQVREDAKGDVHVVGLSEETVADAAALLDAIDRGNRLRTTQRTEKNDASSRSHAVCQICLRGNKDGADRGKLGLVDLAGSERGADTRSHSRQLRTESAEINKSLLALKECIRGLATNDQHVPFRASKLTMVLRDSFVRSHCRVAMIATVSPGVSATDHTVNTLRYADRIKEKPTAAHLNARNLNNQAAMDKDKDTVSAQVSHAAQAKSDDPPPQQQQQQQQRDASSSSSRAAGSAGGGTSGHHQNNGPSSSETRPRRSPQRDGSSGGGSTDPEAKATAAESQKAAAARLSQRRPSKQSSLRSSSSMGDGDRKPPRRPEVNDAPSSADRRAAAPRRRWSDRSPPRRDSRQHQPEAPVVAPEAKAPAEDDPPEPDAKVRDPPNHRAEHDDDLVFLHKTIQQHSDDPDVQPSLDLYRTVDSLFEEEEALLNAHMNMIQENAELLTEEGKMLQQVQIAEDYNIDDYVGRLDAILNTKAEQIASLKARLQRFSQKLKEEETQSRLVRRMPMF